MPARKAAKTELKAEPKRDSIFGSQEEADAELLAELGINPDETLPDNVPEGIEGTEEERARLEAEIRKELNKISTN